MKKFDTKLGHKFSSQDDIFKDTGNKKNTFKGWWKLKGCDEYFFSPYILEIGYKGYDNYLQKKVKKQK